MESTEQLTPAASYEPLPKTIEVPDLANGLTPNEMRALKVASGRRLDDVFGDAADLDDKTQAVVFVALRRAGFDPTWEDAGDVQPVQPATAPDPTNGARSPA